MRSSRFEYSAKREWKTGCTFAAGALHWMMTAGSGPALRRRNPAPRGT